MSSLFVLSTPLQMLTSQQLIRQENITDAILLESSFSWCNSFQPSYDVCRIEELWMKRLEPVLDFPSWDAQGISLQKTALTTYRRFRKFIKLLKRYDVDTIYLADYQNQTYRFMTETLSLKGYKVCFFEEGYSHYVPRPYTLNNTMISKIKELTLDLLYYLPLYHTRFAKWRNCPNRPYKGLNIHKRYSIVPGFLNETYDERLYCEPMVSKRLSTILYSDISTSSPEKRILLLTDPLTEVLSAEYKSLYYDVIKDALSKLDATYTLCIKYHPRDTDEEREKTEMLVKELGIKYKVLSTEVNIPVEYFLLNIHFEKILFFNTSTFFYNGYLFPKCEFVQLLPNLICRARIVGAPSNNIWQMEQLVEKMKCVR